MKDSRGPRYWCSVKFARTCRRRPGRHSVTMTYWLNVAVANDGDGLVAPGEVPSEGRKGLTIRKIGSPLGSNLSGGARGVTGPEVASSKEENLEKKE